MQINLRAFRLKATKNKLRLKRFLTRLKKNPPRGLDALATQTDKEVWKEIDCLSCGNCCKTMSPTYTKADIRRISAHLEMSVASFTKKWLRKDSTGDWLNKTEPCQFLNLKNNYCSIYEVRPADCAGFPHHNKRHMTEYMHVFKQNIEYCPATYKLVEMMLESTQNEELKMKSKS